MSEHWYGIEKTISREGNPQGDANVITRIVNEKSCSMLLFPKMMMEMMAVEAGVGNARSDLGICREVNTQFMMAWENNSVRSIVKELLLGGIKEIDRDNMTIDARKRSSREDMGKMTSLVQWGKRWEDPRSNNS